MSYDSMYNSCAFFIGEEVVRCGEYTLEKFKECLRCKYKGTACEAYTCSHADGKNCLLQIGKINHFMSNK